jgi:hypothetical protein
MDAKKTTGKRTGPELDTRQRIRRQSRDRRGEVRFEPDKQNRRQNKGRRSADADVWGP